MKITKKSAYRLKVDQQFMEDLYLLLGLDVSIPKALIDDAPGKNAFERLTKYRKQIKEGLEK